MKFCCFSCGYETHDKGRFLDQNTNGDVYWMEFICPQCRVLNPPVAEHESCSGCKPRYEYPNWSVVETNAGLYTSAKLKTGVSLNNPMLYDHQLAKAPANLLRPELKGTMMDYSKWLIERGNARSRAFHEEYDEISHREGLSISEQVELIDQSRKQNHVGPYDIRIEHDGVNLMLRHKP